MKPRWIVPVVAGLVSGASISALAATVQISMDNLEIAPQEVSAKVGDTIEWVNKDVKDFAEDMVRDHEAVNRQALDLVKKLNVTPEDNDTSKTLSKNAADKLAELGKLKGADFDKAYVANEVAYHKAVDSALETTLIPSASMRN